MRKETPLAKRFWPKVAKTDEGACWEWLGNKNKKGYGGIGGEGGRNGRWVKAHRVAWELTNGPIPQGEGYHGICVLHRCDNPGCVNPAHLFLGTVTDNNRDMMRKGRNLHGDRHHFAKITEADVLKIRSLIGKRPYRDIATQFGIDQSHVSRIKTGDVRKEYVS